MAKKIVEASFVCLFVLFSFYYTEKATEVVEKNDPVMQKIYSAKEKLEVDPVNAIIDGTYLTPGYAGVSINASKSFDKMKQYGSYRDSLLVFEESKPTISKEEYYDKYIVSGNGFTNNVALVFKVSAMDSLDEVKTILNQNDVRATFFIDGVYLEKNQDKVLALAQDFHEIEILSYNNGYDRLLFEGVMDKLQVITNTRGKYCYAEYDQKEVLDLCQKEKMHTIIPTMKVDSNAYNKLKGKVEGGSIISMSLTNENRKELSVVIQYIKQRGYTLDTLDNLLNEARNIEK